VAVSPVPVVLVVRRRVASSSLGLVAREHPVVPVAHLVVHPCCSAVPAVREHLVVRVSLVPVVPAVRVSPEPLASRAASSSSSVVACLGLVAPVVRVSPVLVVSLVLAVSSLRRASSVDPVALRCLECQDLVALASPVPVVLAVLEASSPVVR